MGQVKRDEESRDQIIKALSISLLGVLVAPGFLPGSAMAAELRLGGTLQTDNAHLGASSGAVEIRRLKTSWGEFGLESSLRHFAIEDSVFGFHAVSGQAFGAAANWLWQHEGNSASLILGVDDLGGSSPAMANSSTPVASSWRARGMGAWRFYTAPGGSHTVTLALEGGSGLLWDNPVGATAGMRSHEAGVRLDMRLQQWLATFGYSGKFFPSLDSAVTARVLSDDAASAEVPANHIHKYYGYAYRPVLPFLYLGGFASFSDSRHDLMMQTGKSSTGERVYTYFPYSTPLETWSTGLTTVLTLGRADGGYGPAGKFKVTAKVNLPLWSSMHYTWEDPIWGRGTYPYSGTEPFGSDLKLALQFNPSIGLEAGYAFLLKPYYRYGYLRSESYRLQNLELRTTWSWN